MYPSLRLFKLAPPNGDGENPYINETGVFIGDGSLLVDRSEDGFWRVCRGRRVEALLAKAENPDSIVAGLERVTRYLNGGEIAKAHIALVLMRLAPPVMSEQSEVSYGQTTTNKFDPLQPRVPKGSPAGGQWTSGSWTLAAPNLTTDVDRDQLPPGFDEVAYNGVYHDMMVVNVAIWFRSNGVPTETFVPLTAIASNITAIPDIMVQNPITNQLSIIEIKTGIDPTFTPFQSYIYPLAMIGDHVFSSSPKMMRLGYLPDAPLPPILVDVMYFPPNGPFRVIPLYPEFEKMVRFAALSYGTMENGSHG